MSTKIYLIRHAEAEGNLFRVAHGQYNSTLTPRGYRQLRYLRDRFRDIHIDAVYGSDLLRAHTTASAIYAPKGLEFHPMPLLRELGLGIWEQMSWGEILRMDADMYVHFNKRPDLWHAEGAETFPMVRDRMLAAVRQIAAENPGKVVAATSHGAALRTLLGTLQGMSLEEIGKTGHADNTAVSLIEVDGDEIRVIFRDDNSHTPPEFSTFRRQSWHKGDAATDTGLWFRWVSDSDSGAVVDGMLEQDAVGRIAFRPEKAGLRITEFAVIPALRGQRYGVQLLGQAVQYARRKGLEDIVLTCPEDLADYFAQYGFAQISHSGEMAEVKLDLRLVMRDIP